MLFSQFFCKSKTVLKNKVYFLGLPWWRSGYEPACQCRGQGFEPWSGKIPHAVEQLSLCATTTESVLWSLRATTTEACTPRPQAPQQEKPLQWEACTPQRKSSPRSPQLEKATHSNKDPMQTKINKFFLKSLFLNKINL